VETSLFAESDNAIGPAPKLFGFRIGRSNLFVAEQ